MPNLSEQAAKFSEQVENLVRIVKHGKREQTLFALGLLCLALPTLLPQAVQDGLFALLPDFFKQIFSKLSVIGLALLLWGVVLVWRKALPRSPSLAAVAKPSAIKGPFAFSETDGEIFSQLGREADLGKLLGWVLDSQICLAALKGESGAGKTSLLRAGLAYTLTREKEKHGVTPIYWEAVPENSAAELLRTIHMLCPEEKERLQTLDDLLAQTSARKKVVIIDQAEQLSPEKHRELFALFKKIAAQKPPYSTTWIIAFREEYASTWFEFEADNPDFLPPKHSLKIFNEAQARDLVAVLARESGLSPDEAVITEMVNAMSDKGKVSPVEIGVGMMVLNELYSGPESAISLGKFQDAGGVTGLLRAYIKGKLEDGMPEHERSPVQAALLELIDPEISHQRLAQGKTAEELAHTAQLPLPRMRHNLRYLASQEVRILEEVASQENEALLVRYRLAHERLIPGIESLAGELLAAADQARRLLNERYRTWAKARQRKFLLSGKELREVLKYRGHFAAALSSDLLRYLRASKQARALKFGLVAVFGLGLLLWPSFNARVLEPWKRAQRFEQLEAQFVAVEGGVFDMGDSFGDGFEDERPVHKVKLSDFKISKYEITNQEFCDFLNADDSAQAKVEAWLSLSDEIRKINNRFVLADESQRDHPVVNVNWFGAAAFCNYMNKRNGYQPAYNLKDGSCDFSIKGFRLPTEAEWEYTARGGKKSRGYRYSGSDSLDAVAWYNENSDSKIHAVGQKRPNELGLYDMSGNVWEWSSDWYGENYYAVCERLSVVENPTGPERGSDRMLRGGSWIGGARYCRSTYRDRYDPSDRYDAGIGFRLVFVP